MVDILASEKIIFNLEYSSLVRVAAFAEVVTNNNNIKAKAATLFLKLYNIISPPFKSTFILAHIVEA